LSVAEVERRDTETKTILKSHTLNKPLMESGGKEKFGKGLLIRERGGGEITVITIKERTLWGRSWRDSLKRARGRTHKRGE